MRNLKKTLSLLLTLCMVTGMFSTTAFAEETIVDNGDGTTTVTNVTNEVHGPTTEDGVTTEGSTTTETSVTTDAEGNVLTESEKETGSETSTTDPTTTETTEIIIGSENGVEITTKAPGEGETETTVTIDDISQVLLPDTSGEEWAANEDGSKTKTETNEDGSKTTTDVSSTKDENGKDVYTIKTTTTTERTESVSFDVPAEGETNNTDGSKTTVTLVKGEAGNVIGYKEVTEMRDENGTLLSSTTKDVSQSGEAKITTTTINTKTQVVLGDKKDYTVGVTMGKVTEEKLHGAFKTHGLEIVDTPEDSNGLLPGKDVDFKVDDLKDSDLVYVSGIGLVSQYKLKVLINRTNDPSDNDEYRIAKRTFPARQMTVVDKDGNEHTVYCADLSVFADPTVKYYLTNTEDADYYTNNEDGSKFEDGGAYLREIATNGYWGTADGEMGSLSKLKENLLAAKEAGDPALNNLSVEDIEALTEGQALAATQAALWKYGNSLTKNSSDGSAIQGAEFLNSYSGNTSDTLEIKYDEETKTVTKIYKGWDSNGLLQTYEQNIVLNGNRDALQTIVRDDDGNIIKISYKKNGGNISFSAKPAPTLQYDEATRTITKITREVQADNTIKTTTQTVILPPDYEDPTILYDQNGDISRIKYNYYVGSGFIKMLPDEYLNGDNETVYKLLDGTYAKDSLDNQLVEGVYMYLAHLADNKELKNETTDLIQPSDIVEAVTHIKEAAGEKDSSDRDLYKADVSFVLAVEPDRLNGDLKVTVYDSKTGEALTTRRLEGDGSQDDPSITTAGREVGENGITYTIDDLTLANGQKISIKLNGSQEVKKGAYLITAQTGNGDSQTFVSVEEGTRDVDLSFDLQLNVKGVEVKTTETEQTTEHREWTKETNITYSSYELDLPDPDRPTPDRPTPNKPDVDLPDPDVPLAELPDIPDEDVPLADIPDEDVPLAELPDIPDPEVPLSDVPMTGDSNTIGMMSATTLAACILLFAISKKRKA